MELTYEVKDEKNSSKWKEILDAKPMTKDKWYKMVEETFRCDPCMLIMNKPVTLPCGHSGCLSCFEKYYKGKLEEADPGKTVNRDCWLCREDCDLGETEYKDYRNKELEAALKFIFPGYTNERDGVTAKVLYKAPKGPSKSRKPAPKAKEEKTEKAVKKPGPRSRKRSMENDEKEVPESPKKVEKPKSRPGPRSKTKRPASDESEEESSKSPIKMEKAGPKSKPGPKSKKKPVPIEDENDENEVVEKPGPKSSKKMEEYEPQPSTSGIKPKNKKPKPGPKSKKRKRDDSEDEDDDDSEEFEAKRPRTLNSRQKKLLGQINYNLDED